ncbi:MAG: TonB-dependent receptor [Tannerella sp.]|jgi:TonB-linked SusC/RagA family outer membrane protein|nr:TonB-dependent receptor [Tannerella sp.]
MENAAVRKVLNAIEKKSDFYFTYNSRQINADREVSIKANNRLVSEVLDELFEGENVKYTINDKHIVLYKEIMPERSELSVTQQGKRISGTITDEKGETIIGANVIEKGTTNGIITDLDGRFSLEVSQGATLVISYIGYVSQEIAVGSQTSLKITMVEDTKVLEEVIVLGYGASARKADLSASIGIVENMEALKNRPVANAASLLQGQIPGVTVRNNGGDPSADLELNIRGQGSRKTESVLWVVDGVAGAPFNYNDIESIVVLKDAASAAIYGAYSGSAGVILVTTKKAATGKATITYEGSYGVSQATNLPQSLTIEQEKQVRQASYDAGGGTLPTGWDVTKNPYIGTTRTDWIGAITRIAPFQRHYITLTGGNETMSNRLSVSYTDNQGTLVSTFNKNFQVRYDATYKLGKYIRLREDAIWKTEVKRGTSTDDAVGGSIISAMMMPRNAEVYYPDGTYGGTAPKDPEYIAQYGSNFADIHGDVINPFRMLDSQYQYRKPSTINSSTFLEIIDPVPGLKFTSRFTYKLDKTFDKTFNFKRLEVGKPNAGNSLNYESSSFWRWETENTLNYDKDFGDHRIGALLSTTANKQRGLRFYTGNTMFDNEDPIYQYLEYGTVSMSQGDTYMDPDNNVSAVGRLSYSWNDRYFATASFRRDYAGRLPEGKKYGDFPAVTGAWKVSEEGFFPKSETVNLLKFRGSWGRIGNLSSIPFAYGNPVLDLSSSGSRGIPIGVNTPSGNNVSYTTAFNPYLTWETSEQTDFGMDLDLLSNRLSVSVDYFNKKTFNLIKAQDMGWPSYIGVNAKTINEGEIHNSGFEFTLGWQDKVGDFTYFVNANLGTLKNKITDIGPVNPETGNKPVWKFDDTNYRSVLYPYQSAEGQPLYAYWLIKSDGLFQSDAEAAAYVDKTGARIQPNAVAGDMKFVDNNGDGKINDEDRVYMGSYFPGITYGLTGGFTYKDLSFSLLLQGVADSKAFQAWKYTMLNEGFQNFNRWNRILDAYPKTNDIPRVTTVDRNSNFGTQSDWYLEDASYLRIKNVNIAYALNGLLYKMSPQLKEQRSALSVYASIDNLYTFTKYTGMNPEIGMMGMDQGKYPVPRVFSFGIKLTY